MLEIKNVEIYGLERSLCASGNPMSVGEINTKSSRYDPYKNISNWDQIIKRSKSLGSAKSGSGHDNYLKGIIVQFDVKYPQYWAPESQRYHWFEILSSQSKMHRLATMGRTDDFDTMFNKYVELSTIELVQKYVHNYNILCEYQFSEEICDYYHVDRIVRYSTKEELDKDKYFYFMKALSNLPMGFEMWETISTNYLQLKGILHQRYNHKLDEWRYFCEEMLKLPMFKELIGFDKEIKRL